ncbi:RDD family protein [Parafrigoribacterium soli]|uniref:RDD family protein n=1 Tax=Parafrigoribacterium soli TaxID=3144663 RepID=UPI0032EE5EB5
MTSAAAVSAVPRAPVPGFGRRIAALAIDYALILAYMAVIGGVALLGFVRTGRFIDWLAWGSLGAEFFGFLVLVLPIGIYFFLCEASSRRATVGKRALGLVVVRAGGLGRASAGRIAVRAVVKLIPWEVAHFFVWQAVASGEALPGWVGAGLVVANVLPIIYVLVVLLQRERRGPHDLAAGTRVVRV